MKNSYYRLSGIVLFLIFFHIIFSHCFTVFAKENPNIRLAIIPAEGERAPLEAVVSQLEIQFSKFQDITLLERSQISKIIEELQLGTTGVMKAADAPRLGKMLAAPVLLYADVIPKTEPVLYRLRFVESATGIILANILKTSVDSNQDITDIRDALAAALKKQAVPLDQRHLIGILGINNTDIGTQLDGTAEALSMFLSVDLAQAPEVIVLEREDLQYLEQERFAGLDIKLKTSSYLLEGGLQNIPGQKNINAKMTLRPLADGQEGKEFALASWLQMYFVTKLFGW